MRAKQVRLSPVIISVALLMAGSLANATPALQQQLDQRYASEGATLPASAERGEALWNKTFTVKGQNRSCVTCHGDNLRSSGKHNRTSKVIKPMAPSVNPERFSSVKKVEKWFKRNCKWTIGRACSAQEKRDLLDFLATK